MPPRTRKEQPVDDVEIVKTEEVPDADVPALADAMAKTEADSTSPEPDPLPPTQPVDPDFVDPEPEGEGVIISDLWEDRRLTWPHEPTVDYRVPHIARGKIVTQLLQAADDLGYPPAAIRSQSDGFLVPSLVYYHLFPSQTPVPAEDVE